MKSYYVKSKSKSFPPFQMTDDGLGYFTFNIEEKIAKLKFGGLGEIIGSRVKISDILVRPNNRVNGKKWFSLKHIKNSSVAFLEHRQQDGDVEVITRLYPEGR